MSHITYEPGKNNDPAKTHSRVRLGSRIIGHILELHRGYRYKPKGGAPGDVYHSLDALKASLEAD